MGYWTQNAEGHSFAGDDVPDEQQLIWGDQPADVIDNAIDNIKIVFMRDLGRLPSKAEILAGIQFSTRVLDGLPERPEDAVPLTEHQQEIIERFGYLAQSDMDAVSSLVANHREATAHVGQVLKATRVETPEPTLAAVPDSEG